MKRKVLFVCLGNICRSPTAEGVLRAMAASEFPAVDLEVDSAGTADYHVGEPPDRRTLAAARRRGYDLAGLRARRVESADFDRFDLVLAMDRANLAELERLKPAGARARVALFLDFAPDAGTVEVPDPYYADSHAFERVLDLCEAGARSKEALSCKTNPLLRRVCSRRCSGRSRVPRRSWPTMPTIRWSRAMRSAGDRRRRRCRLRNRLSGRRLPNLLPAHSEPAGRPVDEVKAELARVGHDDASLRRAFPIRGQSKSRRPWPRPPGC